MLPTKDSLKCKDTHIFKVRKGKNLQPRLLYPARISFRFDREIKTFTDKQKLREFSTTKPALQQMLKEVLYTGNTGKEKTYNSKPETINSNRNIHIDNYPKCKRIKRSNQKTQTG